jgi:lysophospholipase L1-like esterase
LTLPSMPAQGAPWYTYAQALDTAVRAAGTSTLSVASTVTASGALVTAKHNPVNATSGVKAMTLPTGAASGTLLSVEKTDASTNAVTITGNIRGVGGTTISLVWQNEDLMFAADTAGSWWPVAGHKTKASLDAAYDAAGAASLTWRDIRKSRGYAGALRWWDSAVAKRSYRSAKVMIVGDSITEGMGATTYQNAFPARLGRALHSRLPVPGAAPQDLQFIPPTFASTTIAASNPWTWTSGVTSIVWGPGSRGQSIGGGSMKVVGDKVAIITAKTSAAGSYSYSIDGGTPVTVTTGGFASDLDAGLTTVVTLGPVGGAHRLTLANVSGTVWLDGVIVYNGDQGRGIQVIDSSHTGFQASSTTFANYSQIAQGLTPDLVVIEFGNNDQTAAVTATTLAANVTTLISSIKTGCTAAGAHIPSFLVLQVPVNGNDAGAGANSKWSAYKTALQGVADADPTNVAYYDISDRFPAGNASDTLSLYYDGLHWNDNGAALAADVVAELIAPAVDPAPVALSPSTAQPDLYDLKAWSYDKAFSQRLQAPLGSGKGLLIGIPVPDTITVTTVELNIGVAGSGLTSGQNLVALFDSDGTQLGSTSADQTTAWASTGTKRASIGGPVTITGGRNRMVYVFLISNGTTLPQFLAFGNSLTGTNNLGLPAGVWRSAWDSTTRTTMPTTLTLSALLDWQQLQWAGLV